MAKQNKNLAKNRADAEAFIRNCCRTIGMGFHPDSEIADYIKADGSALFTSEESAIMQTKLDDAHKILRERIYEIGLDEFHKMQPLWKYSKPQNAAESNARFVLVEFASETIVKIRLICDLPFPPIETVAREEIEPA